MLKLNKKTGVWSNSTGTLYFNPRTMTAYSYDWYRLLGIVDGKLTINTYKYSVTTSRHKRELLVLLDQLGIKVEAEMQCDKGLPLL